MIDLTPLEVRKKKGDFKKALRGYEPVLVDDFLDLVADRLDQLVRENMSMTERLNRLENQVAENRERERALTDALVTAQEMREEVRQQTAREADLLRRTAEQESAQVRRNADQHAAQTKHAAEQEAAQIRSDVLKMREREEEVLRRLRARQQQLLQSYRTFLAREMAELQVIGETLDIEDTSLLDAPRTTVDTPRATPVDAPRTTPRAPQPPKRPAPNVERAPMMDSPVSETPIADSLLDAPVADMSIDETDTFLKTAAPVIAAAAIIEEFEAPADTTALPDFGAELGASAPDEEEPGADADDSAAMRMLDAPLEMNLQTDMLDNASIMGAIEVAILEDDEPFAPEPVDEWDDDVDEDDADVAFSDSMDDAPEPEIGAPDHDATVLLENALRAGYRIDLDDDDVDEEEAELELLLDDAADEDDDAEPPRGWLDKMIDDEER